MTGMLVLACTAAPLLAQPVQTGVPASVIDMRSVPGEAVRHYGPELPRGTPQDIAEAAQAASEPITDFTQALQRAYWTNPALLAERAGLRSTDYRLPQARAQYGPKLEYSMSYGYQRDNFELSAGGYFARHGWSSTATAILTQPVTTFGRSAAGENTAIAQIDFERNVLRATEQRTLLDGIGAYVGVLRDRAGVVIATDNLDLLERELSDNRARLAVREVTSTDVQQVETRVELGRAQLLAAQRSAASSEADFLRVIGAPAGDLAPPNPLMLPARALEDAYAYGETHNPVIAAAYARERISRAQRDVTRADLLPRVDLRGRADYGTVSPYTDSLRQTELRGEVVVTGPIFESGLRRARVSEASAQNDKDWRLIDGALRDNRAELADAWNEWLTQRASIDRLAAAVGSAQQAYDGALLQERAGFRTTLDVLDLARELLLARSSYNNATAGAYIAQARLLAAMGALEQEYLFPDAERYDPQEHFDKVRHNGDVPPLTQVLRVLDGVTVGGSSDRPLRDPSAPLAAKGVDVPVPPSGANEVANSAGQ